MSDPYSYPPPNDDVLRNVVGIRDKDKLQKYETHKSHFRIRELSTSPVIGSFNERHLSATHKHIFQDVYAWAGDFRTVPIRKSERILGGGSADYAYPNEVSSAVNKAILDMKAIDFSAPVNDIARKLSTTTSQLWLAHPFREGNTRTITTFVLAFAKQRGLDFDLKSLIEPQGRDTFRDALVASTVDMPQHLTKRFEKAISKSRSKDSTKTPPSKPKRTISRSKPTNDRSR